jgi:hypothetical protein
MCRETFDKGWSDEEASAELDANFPDFDTSDCDLVCDDCYKSMVPVPLTPLEREMMAVIAATPAWKAAQKALEDNILYGTPLPNN